MSFLDVFVRGDFIDPATLVGAAFYAFLFILIAWFLARMIRLGVRRVAYLLSDQAASTLLIRLGQVVVYTLAVILYFNAIPQLHSVGTALLASAGVASILFGLAAQTTLSNLVSALPCCSISRSRWAIVCNCLHRPDSKPAWSMR